MLKLYFPIFPLIFSAFILNLPTALSQPTCDSPAAIVQDNFDSYTIGALGPQAAHWTTWTGTEGGPEDGAISDDLGNNALYLEGQAGGGPQDVLMLLGNRTSGAYILEWRMYVPAGLGAYYNIQHFETPATEWAFEINFSGDGTGQVDAGTAGLDAFSFPLDAFFKVRHVIDVDNDRIYLFINGKFVHSWPFSWQADATSGTNQLGAVNFWTRDQNDAYYVDDVVFNEIPSPEAGQYCHLATPVTEGTYAVDAITCFGAGFTVQTSGAGNGGEWFAWTAPSDGILSVSSCEGGGDTRLWIFSGGCDNLVIEGVNDDLCLTEPAGSNSYASYREALVAAGETYLILFDNIWEGNVPFTFSISFSTDAPLEGDFCETAIPVAPGTHTIDQINGDAAVAGPNINHTAASTTNYAQSEWYAFTPEFDGKMNVFTCGQTDEDTRLWIYSGDCGIESLVLVANNDDTCDVQSLVEELPVTANTTYYIEWDSEDADSPGFNWVLEYEAEPNSTVESTQPSLALSPNPAGDVAFLKYGFQTPARLEVSLHNHLGQSLSSTSLEGATDGTQPIALGGLSAGLYFVVVSDGKTTKTFRLVKE
jgi:hypothetical protein